MSDLLEAAKRALPGCRWDGSHLRAIGVTNRGNYWVTKLFDTYEVDGPGVRRRYCATIDEASEYLRAQVTARRDALNAALGEGWVHVCERLPETYTTVLAYSRGKVCEAQLIHAPTMGWTVAEVTYWMPLPAPPKTP